MHAHTQCPIDENVSISYNCGMPYRIDCFADGEMGNSFPELNYEGATISGMTLDWPLHVYYSYPGGLAGDQPGRYDCVTRSRDKISHHLVTGEHRHNCNYYDIGNIIIMRDVRYLAIYRNGVTINRYT